MKFEIKHTDDEFDGIVEAESAELAVKYAMEQIEKECHYDGDDSDHFIVKNLQNGEFKKFFTRTNVKITFDVVDYEMDEDDEEFIEDNFNEPSTLLDNQTELS